MLENLYIINLTIFIGGVLLFATCEYFFTFRKKTDVKLVRWGENFSLTFLNTFIIRLLFFVTPLSAAVYVNQNEIGLFYTLGIPTIIG